MKILTLLLISLQVSIAQVDTAGICTLTFGQGVHGKWEHLTAWANFIVIDSAEVIGCDFYATRYFVSASTIDSTTNLHVVNCALSAASCDDNYSPGIAVLKDSCITDDEWKYDGYAEILGDSSDFFTLDAFMLYQLFEVAATDDCGIDSFFVKSLVITPPGGTSRPPGGTRRFDVTFRAVDFTGKQNEVTMTWVRNDNENCKLD